MSAGRVLLPAPVEQLSARLGRVPVTERQGLAATLWQHDHAVCHSGRVARSGVGAPAADRKAKGESEQERVVESRARLNEITLLLGRGNVDLYRLASKLVIERMGVAEVALALALRRSEVTYHLRLALNGVALQVYRLRELA